MVQPTTGWFGATRLKTRHLLLLVHLYEQRSVLRAAEAANMSQPAASKLLAEMERLLGVPLFERHARGVEPTWYGQALIRRARAALSEIAVGMTKSPRCSADAWARPPSAPWSTPARRWCRRQSRRSSATSPTFSSRSRWTTAGRLVARLLDGHLDIVIGRIMDADGSAELDFEPLADEPHSAIVRASHPLATRERLTHADLADHGWIMPPEASVLRSRLHAVFLENGLPLPRDIVETASLPVIIHLLRHSDMITALPVESVGPYLQTGQMKVLPIELGVRMEFFGIIRRRDQLLSPGAERVLGALRSCARRIYPST